jgi:ABC-2 type transport system ATP-binding protein
MMEDRWPRARTAMAILVTEGLTKRYGATLALDRLDLALEEGSIFGFLGPNGSGKTTAIRLLLGLLRPSAGSARIFGLDCWRESARAKGDVGYLPGDVRLYPNLCGRALLGIFGRARGRDLAAAGRDLAERFDLDLSLRVRAMSKGTRQKLGLLVALAHEPRLLILDEPTSGLDPIMQDRLKSHLRDLAARGHTIFFSSHSLAEVEQLCDRVAILRGGQVVIESTLEALRARARREVRIGWRESGSPPSAAPAGLEIVERDGVAWRCRLSGPVGPLVKWIASAAAAIDDLTISPPDLESLFHEYYQEEAGIGREPGGPAAGGDCDEPRTP